MHDMTKPHTEELAAKYEDLPRKQESKYEDVVGRSLSLQPSVPSRRPAGR